MDLERYYELRAILQGWRMRLAESIRRRIEDSARWLARLHAIYEGEGAGEDFATWLDRWCRQAAIQFILRVLFLRVLEDRDLLGAIRIRNTDGQRMWAELTRNLGAAHYVQWCGWDAAHLLPDLFGPTDYDLVLPDDDLAQRFLDDVWRRPDPNRSGWLRFDFRPMPPSGRPPDEGRWVGGEGDEGFQTRFIGDLYQELDAEMRERYALLQTPHFISQFILEHTLLERFKEKGFREVTLIDPTCGSGHFLVDAFWMFVEQYEAALAPQDVKRKDVKREEDDALRFTSQQRAEIARRIVEHHLFGCDINPYATALARFRLILAACDYARPTSLGDFRDLRFNLVTIDSLIPYEKLMVGGVQAGGAMAKVLGHPDAIQRALPVLRKRYDVVVGNPPYITAQDGVKRDLYREQYESAYRGFGLSAPFTERFLQLAMEGGHVGLINSNAFARRQFGKKLIESVLPHYDLGSVIDLSGAYIPGHGTPTLILLARNQAPANNTVLVLSNLKGESGTPTNPAQGQVWRSVVRGFAAGHDYIDEYVDVAARPRESLAQHPWQFGGAKGRLYDKLCANVDTSLGQITVSIGRNANPGYDEIFLFSIDSARRYGFYQSHLKFLIRGEEVRDWFLLGETLALYPYDSDEPIDLNRYPSECEHLRSFHSELEDRKIFGVRMGDGPRAWFEFLELYLGSSLHSTCSTFAEIATHNHFVLSSHSDYLFKQTAPVIKLLNDTAYSLVTAILNTNIICFCLKQICFNKGAGVDPVRDRYVYAGNYVGLVPIPRGYEVDTPNRRRMLALAGEMISLADQLPALAMRKLFEQAGEAYHAWNASLYGYVAPHPDLPPPFATTRELRAARDKLIALRRDIRGRMIFLQEEMDWLAYDWPKGYQPAPLPESLRPLTEGRIAIIESNSDIALLEDPLYKRRWIPPDYDKEFHAAAEWWLAEKLEWALEQHGRPISLREWARLLGRDERVNTVLEVLTGSPAFDLEGELLQIIGANAVPDRPEHYLKASGLRKFYAVRNTQHVPQFSRKDFADGTAWKLRGKLNIPRERFIAYTQFDHTLRGAEVPETAGPWFGWAGWDAAGRADALAFLLDRANRAGWATHWQQCGLRASLRGLLSELGDLPAAERAEFEAIAGMCGIGLGTTCYCQAYRDGVARGEPGVPGVGEEALGVKVLPAEVKRPGRGKRKAEGGAEQLKLDWGNE
jgi:hypothetical protein